MDEINAFRIAYELYCSEFEYVDSEEAGREFADFISRVRADALREGALWALRAQGYSESGAERAFENIREAEGLERK